VPKLHIFELRIQS